MVPEGRALAKIHKNVVVKVPITREFQSGKGTYRGRYQTNVTVTFSRCGDVAANVARLYQPICRSIGYRAIRNGGRSPTKTIFRIRFRQQILTAAVRHPLMSGSSAGGVRCLQNDGLLPGYFWRRSFDHHPPWADRYWHRRLLKDWAKRSGRHEGGSIDERPSRLNAPSSRARLSPLRAEIE